MTMNALITGGAGFIGSHLAERLVRNRHKVAIIDNLSTGSLANLNSCIGNLDFKFVRGDIRDEGLVQLLMRDCDVVFHLAAAVGVQLIAEDPVRTIETNIGGTEVVLSQANKFGKKVFIASTSEVYGKSEAAPFREDDDLVLGSTSFSRWSYACSKAIDEFLGLAYHQQYGLPVVIGRFFNTIGPRQTGRYGMVVPRFVQWALRNEPIQIYGTGEQTRCFCHVGDVVDALLGLIDCPDAGGKVFNVGSCDEISIESLADKIIATTRSKSKKKFVPYEVAYSRPIEDMMRRVPCVDRIKAAIGWQPRTSLDQTLQLIIDDQKLRISQ
jgi:UDP-glucose 4-epimerase